MTTENRFFIDRLPAAYAVEQGNLSGKSLTVLFDTTRMGALNNQVQHLWETMLHGKNIPAVEH
jgi:hypothetical protein